jgi:hypothetical protein
MAEPQLHPRCTPSAHVEQLAGGYYRLIIPAGTADSYRLAQLDDYHLLARRDFPCRSPFTLSLSARTSSLFLPGTWGFGLWNDPFGLSIGFGGKPFRLPALPNAAWFFGASKENYLSFASGFAAVSSARQPAANGFLAQVFRSPRFHPLVILAGLAFPFSRKWTRRLMSKVIAEDGVVLNAPSGSDALGSADSRGEKAISVDTTQWHRYRLEWSLKRVVWEVDEVQVFESAVSPNPPLGLVIWIDNQYAAFTPEGRIGFGVLENPEPAWLEIRDLALG